MKKQEKSNRKDFLPVILILLICVTVIVFTFTYALFSYRKQGKNENAITTADVNVLVDDEGKEGISQVGAFPVYDEVGRQSEPYTFMIKNLGTLGVNYKIKLVLDEKAITEDNCKEKLLPDKAIKMQLIKDGKVEIEKILEDLEDYTIDEGYLGLEENVNKMHRYELRLWLDSKGGAEVMEKHYHGRIDVEIIDSRKNP